jgi:hypothetical protein
MFSSVMALSGCLDAELRAELNQLEMAYFVASDFTRSASAGSIDHCDVAASD